MEIWKPIKGFEGIYEISSHGRIKRLARITINRGYPFRLQEKLKSLQIGVDGYVRCTLIKRLYSVHILVAQHFIPNPENKKEVNHIDRNRGNNHIDNLEWVSPRENVLHSMKIYAAKNNGRHWKSKLNADQVEYIRSTFRTQHTAKELAELFKIDLSMIYSILRNDKWKHTNEKGRIFKRSN